MDYVRKWGGKNSNKEKKECLTRRQAGWIHNPADKRVQDYYNCVWTWSRYLETLAQNKLLFSEIDIVNTAKVLSRLSSLLQEIFVDEYIGLAE